jgi:hypothetical protein
MGVEEYPFWGIREAGQRGMVEEVGGLDHFVEQLPV